MRTLFALILLVPLLAWGQSSLPSCPQSPSTFASQVSRSWHNCVGELSYPWGKYVGEFRIGKRHGQGTFTFSSGDKYVGEYRDDKRHGQGTFTSPSGDKYVGEWRDGRRNGHGIEYAKDGSVNSSGRWENDSLVQSLALDTNRFPFNAPQQVAAAPPVDPGKAERERQAAEAEAERKRRQALEERLAAESRERERQAAEAEAERKRRQELEEQLAGSKLDVEYLKFLLLSSIKALKK